MYGGGGRHFELGDDGRSEGNGDQCLLKKQRGKVIKVCRKDGDLKKSW